MPTKWKRLTALATMVLTTALLSGCSNMMVLDPKGPIGAQQRDLILISSILCAVILVPVLIMTFVIAWRYRDKPGNKSKYTPKWEHSTKLETIWWGIPIVIIGILAVITVRYTYATEPSKPLESANETMVIQVTSLDWKWLFQYPEQDIATVNYLQFPANVPIRFELTSDAPMNSFWIPQLGGQMYTMSGMAMKLHLQADEPGSFFGSGANFTGREFGKMNFEAKATTQEEFDAWVKQIKSESPALTLEGYSKLAEQGVTHEQSFSSFPEGLFNKIVNKYASSHQHGAKTEASTDKQEKSEKDAEAADSTADGQEGHDANHAGH
ncbi:ubiquinol oxidase subunit II [Paenibacillus mendelii]|uniref:Quinol oxidase subunit 2 n=1 Tax=Paenibacillus mendelii TaxID=206163 RepID=A0ABV6J548_9BACL|nr:ubiquinol oxidase subunit II [Paenibacillus mendelii]MCQ6560295.1 ubiquinol oxidase subunit II [Paenibacillus mendelii]